MSEDMGVAASPPGHSDEPASGLAADAGSVPNAKKIARNLSQPMLLLLKRHAEGWRSSLHVSLWPSDPSQPYWSSLDCAYAPPHYHVREALISRGLIEHYSDSAGITPLGREVYRLAQAISRKGG